MLLMRAFTEIPSGFSGLKTPLSFTFAHFQGLFINDRNSLFFVPPIIGLRNSILYAVSAAIVAVGLSSMLAFSSTANKHPARVIKAMIMLPLGTSAVSLGLGYLAAYSKSPQSVRWFPLLIPMAHALIAFPFTFRIIQPAVESIPDELFQAARTLGLRESQLWRRVTLPLVKKQLAGASVFAFAISLGEFGATAFLSRPEYPTREDTINAFHAGVADCQPFTLQNKDPVEVNVAEKEGPCVLGISPEYASAHGAGRIDSEKVEN